MSLPSVSTTLVTTVTTSILHTEELDDLIDILPTKVDKCILTVTGVCCRFWSANAAADGSGRWAGCHGAGGRS